LAGPDLPMRVRCPRPADARRPRRRGVLAPHEHVPQAPKHPNTSSTARARVLQPPKIRAGGLVPSGEVEVPRRWPPERSSATSGGRMSKEGLASGRGLGSPVAAICQPFGAGWSPQPEDHASTTPSAS
jgi:hypothetical protein